MIVTCSVERRSDVGDGSQWEFSGGSFVLNTLLSHPRLSVVFVSLPPLVPLVPLVPRAFIIGTRVALKHVPCVDHRGVFL